MNFANIEIRYITRADTELPLYKGSVLRGAFGSAFRKTVCSQVNKDCSDCFLSQHCVYAYVFETPLPPESKIMRRYENVPHPFVIEPPIDDKIKYNKNTSLKFNLTLIGKAIDYLPYFIYSFDEMGQRGLGKARAKLHLESIKQKRAIIYDGKTKTLKNKTISAKIPFSIPQSKIKSVKLTFLTPTRIVHQGEALKNPAFSKIIPNLLRRIFLLAYFHCNEKLPIDFNELINKAQKIKTRLNFFEYHRWNRYSSRQKREIPMEGFVGEVIYEGNLNPFYPYLKAGKVLHIGKGTAFGMGKYKMEVL